MSTTIAHRPPAAQRGPATAATISSPDGSAGGAGDGSLCTQDVQCAAHFGRGLEPRPGLLRQESLTDASTSGVTALLARDGGSGSTCSTRPHDLVGRRSSKRLNTRQALVQHDAQRKEIAACVGRLPLQHLRRHVRRSSGNVRRVRPGSSSSPPPMSVTAGRTIAIPKSRSFGLPEGVTMMFCGLRSR